MRRLLPVLGALLLASACGGEEGLDRADSQAVFRAAMAAVHDGDWATLETLLTAEARSEMERVFERLQGRLRDPESGGHERAQARAQLGERHGDEIRRVIQGGPAEALRFCALLMPREREPDVRGAQEAGGGRTILYTTNDGTLRPVRLVLLDGQWFIADLQL